MENISELQKQILIYLDTIAARDTTAQDYAGLLAFAEGSEAILAHELLYLEAHGLLVSGVIKGGDDPMVQVCKIKIKPKGSDCLIEGGGLTAEEKIITVRFHEDTLAQLRDCISRGDIDPQSKQDLLKKLQELPASATEHLMKKLLDEALKHWPGALQLIRNFFL